MKVFSALARALLLLSLIGILASCKDHLSTKLLSTQPLPNPTPQKIVIHNLPTPRPTPTVLPQRGAAWVSDTTPPPGSTITVFARFTRGNAQPIAGVQTSIQILYPGQPMRLPPGNSWERTNTDGLATFNINTGNNPDGVVIDVIFVYQNHFYRATTFFATI
jgi:hypothetical protein